MTNLDYIRTLSAEELAEWFYGEWLHHMQYRWSSSQGGMVIWLNEQRAEQTEPKCEECEHYGHKVKRCLLNKCKYTPSTDCGWK